MVSGADILSYKPNADLAGAGAVGGGPTSDLSPILNSLQQQNMQWNAMRFHQAVADRDKTLETFAQNNIDFPMEEGDKAQMEQKYNDMVDKYKANPKGFLTDPETIKSVQRFKADAAFAKTRYAELSKQRQAIAQEVDPQTRQDMIDHLEEQKAAGINKLPQPYFKKLDWDPKAMNPVPEEEVVTRVVKPNEQGLMTVVETKQTDPKKMLDHWSEQNFLEGKNKTLPDQARIYQQFALNNPAINNDDYWNKANKTIEEMNTNNGFKPGDRYYTAPIAVAGPDGKMVPVDQNPVEFGKKFYVANNYKQYTAEPVLSKDAQNMLKTKAQQGQAESATQKNQAQTDLEKMKSKEINDLLPHKISKLDAEAELARKRGDAATATALNKQKVIAKPVNDAISTFNNIDALHYKPFKSFTGIDPASLSTMGTNEHTQITEVPMTELGAVKMTSTPSTESGATKLTINKPVKMYAIRNDPKNPDAIKLVGVGKDGHVMKIVDLNQGINELISYEGGYKSKDNVDNQGEASKYLTELQGGQFPDVSLSRIRQHVGSTRTTTTTASPAQQPQAKPSVSVPITGAQLKKEGGVILAFHEGKWKRVISKDAGTGSLNLE